MLHSPLRPPLLPFCEQHNPHIAVSHCVLPNLPSFPVQSHPQRSLPPLVSDLLPSSSSASQAANVRANVLRLPPPPCSSHCPFVLRLHSYAVQRCQFFLSCCHSFRLTLEVHAHTAHAFFGSLFVSFLFPILCSSLLAHFPLLCSSACLMFWLRAIALYAALFSRCTSTATTLHCCVRMLRPRLHPRPCHPASAFSSAALGTPHTSNVLDFMCDCS